MLMSSIIGLACVPVGSDGMLTWDKYRIDFIPPLGGSCWALAAMTTFLAFSYKWLPALTTKKAFTGISLFHQTGRKRHRQIISIWNIAYIPYFSFGCIRYKITADYVTVMNKKSWVGMRVRAWLRTKWEYDQEHESMCGSTSVSACENTSVN